MLYSLLRSGLFLLEPERAHALALAVLSRLPDICFKTPQLSPRKVLGLDFPNPIGLAAGFDKSGQYVDALSKLGFGFIEVGTVTPFPQLGNSKPRLFRIPRARALINRMGFNNPGVAVLVDNLQRRHYQGILGINIGKGKETPLVKASEDYQYCLERVYSHASYIAINISSPNTPDLRALQQKEYFLNLVKTLRRSQMGLADRYGRHVPLLMKLSPDEADETLKEMVDIMLSYKIDGIIATNTTCTRAGMASYQHGLETGGLSGAPLLQRSTACLKLLKQWVGNDMALIGVGGIDSAEAAQQKFAVGADLLQVYTGLIYQGPGLLAKISLGQSGRP